MNFKEIQELINLVNKSNNLTEFKMKNGEFNVTIRTGKYQKGKDRVVQYASPSPMATSPSVATAPVQEVSKPATVVTSSDSSPTSTAPASSGNYIEIKSPMVGTFYRSAGPDKPTFAKVGDKIESGKVVCMIEAMKLFNEIESEVKGTIVKILVEDASPVEYDQVLFLVEP
jgi:acetyl-CoA carboxylase biotin carboxyl carrier protein